MSKALKNCGKLFLVLVMILASIWFVKSQNIHAAEGKTVRVSTAKQLKKAMKNPDVGTIILRTEAYLTITVKPEEAAREKFLIIDSKNVDLKNKAVFSGIEIQAVNRYTESVSGNKIRITGYLDDQINGFIVSGKKQVKSLTLEYSRNYYPGYVVRKGAKIEELVLVMNDQGAPAKLVLNAQNKTVTHNLKNQYGYYEKYKITIDKKGRISHAVCESDGVEFAYDYVYKYDKAGNLVSISGRSNEEGDFTDTYTYSDGNPVKRVLDDWDLFKYDYEYDSKGNLVHSVYFAEYSMDGQTSSSTDVCEYKYDENNRLTYKRKDNTDKDYFDEYSYTYDDKGFLTEEYHNEYGLEFFKTYTYNKYGDMTAVKITSDGETVVNKLKYDKLGNLIG